MQVGGHAEAAEGPEAPTLPVGWPDELATIFGWDVTTSARARGGLNVILDGANMAWAYGAALSLRFGCKTYPCSAGVLAALDYEPWAAAGLRVIAVMPRSYVDGELAGLADGRGGLQDAISAQQARQRARTPPSAQPPPPPPQVARLPSGSWRNLPLWREHCS